jgi:hypothetical protein
MKKYYYRQGDKQFGPFALNDLKGRGITAATPIWYDPLPKWITAAEIPELKEIVNPEVPAATAAKSQVSVQKYFYKTSTSQFGPVSLDELKTKSITADTPIWYDPLPKWTTAGQVNELKPIITIPVLEEKKIESKPMPVAETVTVAAATTATIELKEEPRIETVITPEPITEKKESKVETPVMASAPVLEKKEEPILATAVVEAPVKVAIPVIEVKEEPKPQPKPVEAPAAIVTPVVVEPAPVVAPAPAATAPAPAVKPSRPPHKKGPAWVTYTLSALVLAAAGYFVYQDMEKNKGAEVAGVQVSGNQPVIVPPSNSGANNGNIPVNSNDPDQSTNQVPLTDTISTVNSATVVRDPATTLTTTPTTKTVTTTNKNLTKAQLQAQKKADDEKKKKAIDDKIKADQLALQQANAKSAAKDAEVRNHWPNYITFGKIDYEAHTLSGIKAFDVPIFNGTNATIDQVTIRIDYIKKGGDIHKSETIVIRNLAPKSGMNGKAPSSTRGNKVNVYITGISSRQLHFCYPVNNGNSADPYYCN